MYQQYKDQNLMVIAMVIEDNAGNMPTSPDLAAWASTYGLTFPVLADELGIVMWGYAGDLPVWLPYTVLIDRGNVVSDNLYPSEREAVGLVE
jgi:hypothetical protein